LSAEVLEPDQYDQWNRFVDNSPQGDVFCYSWWLDAITRSNFKIIAYIKNGEILAGMPLAYDTENRINIPPLTRTLGVLYRSNGSLSLRKRASEERKWLMEILEFINPDDFIQTCTHHNFTDWLPLRWKGLRQTTRYAYIIDYDGITLPDLWSSLNRGRKGTINRANTNGIKVEMSDDFDLVYRFTSLSYERQGLKFRVSFEDLKHLDDNVKKYGNRLILKAVDNTGAIHAVLYIAYNHRSAYALLSGSEACKRKLGGHTLVMWEAVKYFIDKVRYFNFGGSDIENIEAHLRGFGGTLTPYFHIYNEERMLHQNSLRFHLKRIFFHLQGIFRITAKRFSGLLESR